MPRAFHPVGLFANYWCSLLSVISAVSFLTILIETFMLLRAPWFRAVQWFLDFFFYVDM